MALRDSDLLAVQLDYLWSTDEFGFEDPDSAFRYVAALKGDVYRDLDGRRTLRFERQGKSYFLKYHSGVGWPEILKNVLTLRLPVISAAVEWRAINRLHECGIPTMRVAAYGRRGLNPARVESFIITEELAPTESLDTFVEQRMRAREWPALKRELIAEVARMTRRMHHAGINHRDFYLCHFLLDTDGLTRGVLHLSLIDLHRAQLRRAVPQRWRNKDLASLYFSAGVAGLTRNDKLRFLRCYFNQPLRAVLRRERRNLAWLEAEAARLQSKFDRKYAPGRAE